MMRTQAPGRNVAIRSARVYFVGCFPDPSEMGTMRSTPVTEKCSTLPLGQCTSMSSTVVDCPSPKCGRGSLVDA